MSDLDTIILYEPYNPKHGTMIHAETPNKVAKEMEKRFGNPPWILDAATVSLLKSMSCVSRANNNAYEELISAIAEHRTIKVWPDYSINS